MKTATQPRTLAAFVNAHEGETAWVFGKGPSLDHFDMATAGPLRCVINDTRQVVPEPTYCFANDRVNDWAHVYRDGDVLFQPARTIDNDFLGCVRPPQVEHIVYADDYEATDDERLHWDRTRLAAEGLAILRGTLCSVAQILHIMGVRSIVAVGIDGGGQHAGKAQWHTRLRRDHAKEYDAIRDAFIRTCLTLGIALRFYHGERQAPSHQNENGTMKIKFTSNTFIGGTPYAVGQIADLPPIEANRMIAYGRAIEAPAEAAKPAPAPAPKPIETASAKPVVETAVKPVKRTAKKKAPAA